jgi:serine/threonine-protein kinase ULK4
MVIFMINLYKVRVIQRIIHPNILGFKGWYETRNHFWVIYEYCAGGDLRSIIEADQSVRKTNICVIEN